MNNLKKITVMLWISLGIVLVAMGLSLVKRDSSNGMVVTNTNMICISNTNFIMTNSSITNTNSTNTNNN